MNRSLDLLLGFSVVVDVVGGDAVVVVDSSSSDVAVELMILELGRALLKSSLDLCCCCRTSNSLLAVVVVFGGRVIGEVVIRTLDAGVVVTSNLIRSGLRVVEAAELFLVLVTLSSLGETLSLGACASDSSTPPQVRTQSAAARKLLPFPPQPE